MIKNKGRIPVFVTISLMSAALAGCALKPTGQRQETEKDTNNMEASVSDVSSFSDSGYEDYSVTDSGDYEESGFTEGDSPGIVSNDGTFYGEWIDEGQSAAKYQGSDGYIIAVFNSDGTLDHFKEFDSNGSLAWSCDWYIEDVREQEHNFVVGFEETYVIDGERYYSGEIYKSYDLDFSLVWPNEYYENDSIFPERNQQYVEVNSDTFVLWWRSQVYVEEYTYYYEFEDRRFSLSESTGSLPF